MKNFVLSNLFVTWQPEKSRHLFDNTLIMKMMIQNGEVAELV